MVKSKKRIEESMESIQKRIDEHKEKIEKYGHEQPWLPDYWQTQIKNFRKQKEKEEGRLKKK